MKNIMYIVFLALITASTAADAGDLVGSQSYYGPILAVAPGFYGHTGVELPDGVTCRGHRQIILLTNNPRYMEIFSTLVTAQISRSNVKIYMPAAQLEAYGYCTIAELAIGNISAWQ